ncbi:MAG: hypothetical protein IJ558_10240 [Treponema sp.]|nr:hypothetical protein [Treponema sp.]
MANGIEDLHEKNTDTPLQKQNPAKYDEWRTFQGREDADMLQEKSVNWKSKKDWRESYDRAYDD